MCFPKRSLVLLAPLAALFAPCSAWAAERSVVLLPTVTASAAAPDEWHRPSEGDPPSVARWARSLDGVISEAAQDLGLSLDVFGRRDPNAKDLSEEGLIARAKDAWVISPRLMYIDERTVRLEFDAVAPGSKVVLSEREEAAAGDLEMEAVVMLRDLLRLGETGKPSPAAAPPPAPAAPPATVVEPARSTGRAVLAVNAAALGAYVGFSLQRASGSDDPRLTYPLLALGAGIGLGSSIIVADEWDVGTGDAWYLAAGAWWPGVSGILLAKSYGVPRDHRYVYGLAGAGSGVVLATVSLSFGRMGEGGATMAHTGGAFGLVLGGLGDLWIRGDTEATAIRGMGYGSAVGVLAGGALATQFRNVPNSTVLFIDLGGSLGALVGAAAASPVLFVNGGSTQTKNRIWLGSIVLGTVAGGAIGWWTTRSGEGAPPKIASVSLLPYAGIVGESADARGRRAPVLGAGVGGTF